MRFFLDNCLAIRHARALHAMVEPEHSFSHLQDHFPADTQDATWITELGKQGDWVIISGDYRIGKSAHEKAAWQKSGLTVFFLAKGWTNIPPLQQHSKLSLALDSIIDHAKSARPGSGFLVTLKGKIEQVYP